MNMKTTMIALAALAMSGTTHAITSEEIANALDVDPSVGTFSTGGYSDWYVDTNAVNGATSMRSGALPGNSSSWLWSDLNVSLSVKEASYLTFRIKTHSYNNGSYDSYLGIKIDGGSASVYAGDLEWREVSLVVVPGEHLLHFGFGKRYYNNSNSGYCAWVDDFKLTPIMPATPKVEVTNIKCQQRYPWNGMVDIDYTVRSEDPNTEVWVYPIGYDKDSNTSMAPRSLSGDGVDAPVSNGTFRMTWNVTDDYPEFHSTAFTVKMIALTGSAPYMVVDLSGGVDAISYPVSYLSSVPEGGWGDEYKTTKLVLRLIPPGSFMMGSPSDENGRGSYEDLHGVVLTKPFYIGVFEVTQKQYQLVMGATPSYYKGDARPVERVSYNDIRGSVNGVGWPTHNQVDANSFVGRLRSKVNMLFDLPTESQWEYACRAGTSTALNNGKNLTGTDICANMGEVGRYYGNTGDGRGGYGQHTTVGSYLPNAWGLYDMHGNVAEWCLDWWTSNLGANGRVDPPGGTSGESRVTRGGSWYGGGDYRYNGYAQNCRSAGRREWWSGWSSWRATPGNTSECWGFRVKCSPVAE